VNPTAGLKAPRKGRQSKSVNHRASSERREMQDRLHDKGAKVAEDEKNKAWGGAIGNYRPGETTRKDQSTEKPKSEKS